MTLPKDNVARVLQFVEGGRDGLARNIEVLIEGGKRKILFSPFNEQALTIIENLSSRDVNAEFLAPHASGGHPIQGVAHGAPEEADAIVIPVHDGKQLSGELLRYQGWRGGTIVAPITDWHFSRRPLFLISIPKAGTHLLYDLAAAFGYEAGVTFREFARPGHWYCIEYSNSHTVARDFFVDTVRHSPFGNRHHPFMKSPTMMIYRNPLDILVSEANYYHIDGRTSFSGYLSHSAFEERMLRLIDDPWMLGSIRDRVGGFIPWLELPNVIPVSFEELIGPKGGGDADLQQDTIWATQLKLQVDGNPGEFANRIFNPASPTFFEGRIGSYLSQLTPQTFEKFSKLTQDFMVALGYDGSDLQQTVNPPKRVNEFRRRPLTISEADFDATPILVAHEYLECNLVRFAGRFYAVPLAAGPLDLRNLSKELLELLPQAGTVDELQQVLTLGSRFLGELRHWMNTSLSSAIRDPNRASLPSRHWRGVQLRSADSSDEPEIPHLVGAYRDFNIVRLGWNFYGLRQALGQVNWSQGHETLVTAYKLEDFIVGASVDMVKRFIDAVEFQRKLTNRIDELEAGFFFRLDKRFQRLLRLAGRWINSIRTRNPFRKKSMRIDKDIAP